MSAPHRTRRHRSLPGRLAVVGGGLVALAAVTGCSTLQNLTAQSWALTYEIDAVASSDGASPSTVDVSYLDRGTGLADQETVEQSASTDRLPLTIDAMGHQGEYVEITASGVEGVTLQCRILLDGVTELAVEESTPGEPVTCGENTPEEFAS